jgi:hypothetical protein
VVKVLKLQVIQKTVVSEAQGHHDHMQVCCEAEAADERKWVKQDVPCCDYAACHDVHLLFQKTIFTI